MLTEKDVIGLPTNTRRPQREESYKMTDKVVICEAMSGDRIAFWEWRNDGITKKVFNVNGAPYKDRHNVWLERKMQDKGQMLCVGSVSAVRIGCVWFGQHADLEYEVSIYIRPPYCGKGYAAPMLKESISYLGNNRNVKKLFADVRKINASSGRIYEETGFFCVEEDDSKMHYELIL